MLPSLQYCTGKVLEHWKAKVFRALHVHINLLIIFLSVQTHRSGDDSCDLFIDNSVVDEGVATGGE